MRVCVCVCACVCVCVRACVCVYVHVHALTQCTDSIVLATQHMAGTVVTRLHTYIPLAPEMWRGWRFVCINMLISKLLYAKCSNYTCR